MNLRLLTDEAYRQRRAAGGSGWASWSGIHELDGVIFELLARVGAPAPHSILELGCGAGEWIQLLVDRGGFRCTGLDSSKAAIDWARDRVGEESATFVCADLIEPTTLVDQSFDLVVDSRCLHCIVGADRTVALDRCRRWTEGFFIMNHMCGDPSGGTERNFDFDERVFRLPDGSPQRYVGTAEGLLEELNGHGFEVAEWLVRPRTSPEELDDLHALCRPRRTGA